MGKVRDWKFSPELIFEMLTHEAAMDRARVITNRLVGMAEVDDATIDIADQVTAIVDEADEAEGGNDDVNPVGISRR